LAYASAAELNTADGNSHSPQFDEAFQGFCSVDNSACQGVLSNSLAELTAIATDECSFIFFPFDAFDDQLTDSQEDSNNTPFLLFDEVASLLTEVICTEVDGKTCIQKGAELLEQLKGDPATCPNIESLGCCAQALACLGEQFNFMDTDSLCSTCGDLFPAELGMCGGINLAEDCNPLCTTAPQPTPAFDLDGATKTVISVSFGGVSCSVITKKNFAKFVSSIASAANTVLPGIVSSLGLESFATAEATCHFSSSDSTTDIPGDFLLYLNGYAAADDIIGLLEDAGFQPANRKQASFSSLGSQANSNLAANGLPPIKITVLSISTTSAVTPTPTPTSTPTSTTTTAAPTPTPTATGHATGAGNAVFALSSMICFVSLLWHLLL